METKKKKKMKKIRTSVFETNSSTTHSLCIVPEGWDKYDYRVNEFKFNDDETPYIPIAISSLIGHEYSKHCIIKTSNYYKRDDNYFLIEGDLQKIQFIVSSMSYYVYDAMCMKLEPREVDCYMAISRAIYTYMNIKYDVNALKVENQNVYNDGYFIETLISRYEIEQKYTPEEVFDLVTKVISDPSIVFICHSDEWGPYPDDIGLTRYEI